MLRKTEKAFRVVITTTACQTSPLVDECQLGRNEFAIRPSGSADLERVAELHRARLPGGFFVRLGSAYLRAYHRTFLDSSHGIALVADAGGIVGFVTGTSDAQLHRQEVLRRHGVRLALTGALSLLVRPMLCWEFLRTRLRRYLRAISRGVKQRAEVASTEPSRGPVAVLAHIAVDAEAAGTGVGRALVAAFVESADAAGAARVELVTRSDEAGAAGFYERLGWRHVGTSGHDFEKFVLDLR